MTLQLDRKTGGPFSRQAVISHLCDIYDLQSLNGQGPANMKNLPFVARSYAATDEISQNTLLSVTLM